MPTLEERLRQAMTGETARRYAAPDLAERVVRSTRRRRTRGRVAVLATSVAVLAAVPFYLTVIPGAGQAPAVSVTTTASGTQGPPAIDDVPPVRFNPSSLGDLGDGKTLKHVKVGYLPEGLRWSNWSVDYGDSYSTSWNFDGDKDGSYCVQIFVYEGGAVQAVDERVREYRDEKEGQDVTVGDRTGFSVVADVGEDGTKGTPTLILNMGERRRAEIMFSPDYTKRFPGAEAVDRELTRIAEGLTADD